MQKAASRIAGLLIAASCCLTLGGWAAPTGSPAGPAPAKSAPECYATKRDPTTVVCYRTSWKAEFRHGSMVYVPLLIQVPTPSPPPPVTTVDSLDDIRPADTP
ncbi:hypothetical protein [Streptomyces sp. NBC_00557]|uniref:hypothetical protein n=1 Tax=Streptomyces sp. NBC_00557 TaxID=2975776 RepID=UPI002E800EE1|nr:hypothetical protein [Streptomyces sp. NBC_00557]WUC35720.1 hypothetical protein OG956_16555 [Streptomyces sp. NBC_00557]